MSHEVGAVVKRMLTNDSSPGASAVCVVGFLAVTMATWMGAAAYAQAVPALGGSAPTMAKDEYVAPPEANRDAPPWYLKGRFLMGATWGTVASM